MPKFQIETFRAQVMIMDSFGAYSAISTHDHGTARADLPKRVPA
jgi:hypothetical protein